VSLPALLLLLLLFFFCFFSVTQLTTRLFLFCLCDLVHMVLSSFIHLLESRL
jgi:hypothetical protein